MINSNLAPHLLLMLLKYNEADDDGYEKHKLENMLLPTSGSHGDTLELLVRENDGLAWWGGGVVRSCRDVERRSRGPYSLLVPHLPFRFFRWE